MELFGLIFNWIRIIYVEPSLAASQHTLFCLVFASLAAFVDMLCAERSFNNLVICLMEGEIYKS